jgi:hypothetical protein
MVNWALRWLPLLLGIGAVALLVTQLAVGEEPGRIRTMVVILDAVPFQTVVDVIDSRPEGEELFVGFQPVRPMISTFPSSTSVAMVGLLEPFELPRSPGYEARFFDWQERKVRGGGAISFFRIDFAWREFFDWSRKGVVRSAFGGLRPVSASGTRLGKSVEAFFRSPKDTYFIYLETTDLAAHTKGPEALQEVMIWLDEAILEARRRFPESPFRTVIFSDHGVEGEAENRLENVLPAAREAVLDGGFRLTEKLRGPSDVVLTPFGLVSSFEAYTDPQNVVEVATRLPGAAGVDLCVYRGEGEEGPLFVVDEEGQARIERVQHAGSVSWSYEPEGGDPLGYAPVVASLAAGSLGAESFSDELWFEATAGHFYPDALYRIARAFELVENPASVLCSLEPGYMYGMKNTERLARVGGATVRWTHGALHRDATLGFLLTDDERFMGSGALRFDRALVPLTHERQDPGSVNRAADQAPVQRDKMPPSPPAR